MKKSKRFEGTLDKISNTKPFYMVLVEGSHTTPSVKHEDYNEAFQEGLRLANKENKNTYILYSLSQVSLIPKVIQY